MPSNKEYLDYIFEQFEKVEGISYRAMMGEYVVYYRDKVIGGIYDNRFLVKPTNSTIELMPEARYELPYEGAKLMLLVENAEDSEFLAVLMNAIYKDLPAPKPKRKK